MGNIRIWQHKRNIINTEKFSQHQQKGKYLLMDLYLHVSDKIGWGSVCFAEAQLITFRYSRGRVYFRWENINGCLWNINILNKDESKHLLCGSRVFKTSFKTKWKNCIGFSKEFLMITRWKIYSLHSTIVKYFFHTLLYANNFISSKCVQTCSAICYKTCRQQAINDQLLGIG